VERNASRVRGLEFDLIADGRRGGEASGHD
jgi:hypothetical protein